MNDKQLNHHTYIKEDGRELQLYSWNSLPEDNLPAPEIDENTSHSHMRWHPLRQEWVVYSAARQTRTFKPPAEFCPLCVSKKGKTPTEIPFGEFDVAIFDNKFPAFRTNSSEKTDSDIYDTAPAQGKCEVIVYSSDHTGNVGELPQERLELLVEAWIQRYNALRGNHNAAKKLALRFITLTVKYILIATFPLSLKMP